MIKSDTSRCFLNLVTNIHINLLAYLVIFDRTFSNYIRIAIRASSKYESVFEFNLNPRDLV